MLILPPDHQQQTQQPRALTRRERRLVGGVGGVATALVVAVVVALTTGGGPRSSHGCIHAVYAGPVGAEQLNSCGTQAREICAQIGQGSSFGPDARRTIAAECRRAGLPVG